VETRAPQRVFQAVSGLTKPTSQEYSCNKRRSIPDMTRPTTCVLAVAIATSTGCVDDSVRHHAKPDAGMLESAADATPCTKQMFFEDHDADGHGDPNALVMACEQPANTVTVGDDCNDHNAAIHPGATEVCDAVDNDCNAGTVETCPAGCTAVRRPAPDDAHIYLFCTNATNWPNARSFCANAGFQLLEIDDTAENAFVTSEAMARLNLAGAPIHIGANDGAQAGTWQWAGGEVFWVGFNPGQPVNNRFAAWKPGEPNNSDRCVELRSDGAWYDNGCGDNQRFVCRK
jgi:lectin-like protein/putative metal-binding protein